MVSEWGGGGGRGLQVCIFTIVFGSISVGNQFITFL